MKKIKKTLIIGPFPKPISGVSLVNKVVKNLLDSSNHFKVDFINTSYSSFKEDIGKFSIKKILFYLMVNFKVYKIFKQKILYMSPGQTFLGVLKYAPFICLGVLLKKEMIIHVHGNYLASQYNLLSGIKKRTFSFLISRFTKGIVLSNSLKSNLTPFLDSKNIFVLPNFAEDYLVSEKLEINTDELRIVFLSNLMKEKGILILLQALKLLEKQKINYHAKIAGNIDNSLLKEIESNLKLLNKTYYIGVVNGKAKKELLEWGNVFVLPTYYKMEGQPIAIIEAMATKNVIITTVHGGIPDIVVENKNGFFVKKKNAKDLLEKFINLSNNKAEILKISEYNKSYFLNNFTLKQFEKNLLTILNT